MAILASRFFAGFEEIIGQTGKSVQEAQRFTEEYISLLEAEVPLSQLFGYSSAMRSLSQGRATCTIEPKTYGPAPKEVGEAFA